ncbi:hypothetical protein PoB_005141000 [Plakobranchus ocellatus]|uniref:Uncharacterized protein n=1 Tax=Plakobranchus ocellatus TaxID=259542 RepID=A0AAV4BZZ5_9GAST|nr:hypothetical protein PoB_005141000 [Plakobranchus ocellatus]
MVWAHYSLIWPCPEHHAGYRKWRKKKRWEENIREWTGLELRNTLRKAEDREEWKAVVRRSSAAPRRIPDLRDSLQIPWHTSYERVYILPSSGFVSTVQVYGRQSEVPSHRLSGQINRTTGGANLDVSNYGRMNCGANVLFVLHIGC